MKSVRIEALSLVLCLTALLACGGAAPTPLPPSSPSPDAGSTPSDGGMLPGDGGMESDGGLEPDGGTGPWVQYTIRNATARNALCNDGTPAIFWVQRATDPDDANRWVIWLQGGSQCSTESACEARWDDPTQRFLMTSTDVSFPDKGGVLSTDAGVNPDFHGWNHVFAHYCSSDDWAGDRDPSSGDGGTQWYFHGHAIVEALIQDLEDPTAVGSPTLGNASEVLFGGSSAGAEGTVQNLNFVAGMLADAGVPSLEGVCDSAWLLDMPPYGVSQQRYDLALSQAGNYHNAVFDPSCLADYPTLPGKCGKAEIMVSYFQAPIWVFQDQFDPLIVIQHYGLEDWQQDAGVRQYLETVQQRLRCTMSALPGAFSTRVAKHVGALDDDWFDGANGKLVLDGHSYAEVLGNWYFDRTGPWNLIDTPAGASACP